MQEATLVWSAVTRHCFSIAATCHGKNGVRPGHAVILRVKTSHFLRVKITHP